VERKFWEWIGLGSGVNGYGWVIDVSWTDY
jgi:hypothetical protein